MITRWASFWAQASLAWVQVRLSEEKKYQEPWKAVQFRGQSWQDSVCREAWAKSAYPAFHPMKRHVTHHPPVTFLMPITWIHLITGNSLPSELVLPITGPYQKEMKNCYNILLSGGKGLKNILWIICYFYMKPKHICLMFFICSKILEQWFSSRENSAPRRHWATSRDTYYLLQLVSQSQECCQASYKTQDSSLLRTLIQPQMSIVLSARNSALTELKFKN